MTIEEMKSLKRGDIVKLKSDSRTFVVTENYGKRVTAVATVDITNPPEWEVVLKAKHHSNRTDTVNPELSNARIMTCGVCNKLFIRNAPTDPVLVCKKCITPVTPVIPDHTPPGKRENRLQRARGLFLILLTFYLIVGVLISLLFSFCRQR